MHTLSVKDMTKSNTGSDRMIILSHCPCSGATLDKLVQPAILAALTEGPLHGYRLAERSKEMAGMKPR